jgi:asparagine synthase (glutamine-hydrolysing)
MCGIAGIFNLTSDTPVTEGSLRQMLAAIRHRGPDQFGIMLDDGVGLGSARLAIIDPGHGQQPITNEDGSLWIVFNGEIFNYLELRPELERMGHRFKTDTDTEVLLHWFEQFGPDGLVELNGQFAFAIWDARERSLFLARDRLGVRPLFYSATNGTLVLGSEIKALLASKLVTAALDPKALDQVFTYWAPVSPHTAFRGIVQLPPGHWLRATAEGIQIQCYWHLEFPPAIETETNPSEHAVKEQLEQLGTLLTDAVRIRLRADVPVAAYLSGGLDSAVIASLAQKIAPSRLDTFSIAFSDSAYDESEFQRQMAQSLKTGHEVALATDEDIGRAFPQVIWHCETPILRTAPAPMFLLSRFVRQHGFKVALTGEGADELLGGYDLFKEAKIRRFWACQPGSQRRPQLLQRLYPDIPGFRQVSPQFLEAFFRSNLLETSSPFYSHLVRWRNAHRNRRFYSAAFREFVSSTVREPGQDIELPLGFRSWGPMESAQYLEITLFMSNYLLSSQGDRMSMAHGVEGRFPFLDARLIEFCALLPSRLKLRVLEEKFLLRKLAIPWLPTAIARRRKRPYRAPVRRAFFPARAIDYVPELLSPSALRASGFFDTAAVAALVKKLEAGGAAGETDDMALAGIVSSQLLHRQFVENFQPPPPLSLRDNVKVYLISNFSHTWNRRGNEPASAEVCVSQPVP